MTIMITSHINLEEKKYYIWIVCLSYILYSFAAIAQNLNAKWWTLIVLQLFYKEHNCLNLMSIVTYNTTVILQ